MSNSDFELMKRPRASISKQKQTAIVYMRYQSLEDFTKPRVSITHICKTLGMPWTTVYTILKRFVENDFKVLNRKN